MDKILRHASQRAAGHRFFLASDLEDFGRHRRFGKTQLAHFLGCAPTLLPKLALCRRPDPLSPRFQSEILRIAEAFGLHSNRLVQIVREVDVARALRESGTAIEQRTAPGLLMAARETENEESSTDEEAETDALTEDQNA